MSVILAVFVAVAGFCYYLLFGKPTLTPSLHRDLSTTRLASLLAESFSYGVDGAEFVVCTPDGTRGATLRKEVRALDDVHLVLVGPGGQDFGEDTARAAEVVATRFQRELGTPLERGCYYYATGVTLRARRGWSATRGTAAI